jgi:hypothetical protein
LLDGGETEKTVERRFRTVEDAPTMRFLGKPDLVAARLQATGRAEEFALLPTRTQRSMKDLGKVSLLALPCFSIEKTQGKPAFR